MAEYRELKHLSPGQQDEIRDLYRAAGWWFDSDETKPALIERIIAGSYVFCVALEKDAIVGIGRAITDGVSDAYIQDITVRSDLRGRGIGTGLVRFLVDILKRNGFNWIGLVATPQSRSIYKKLGFEEMPDRTPMRLIEK